MSAVEGRETEKPAFSFVSGRHHGPEVWYYVQEELGCQGYESVAHDLPIEYEAYDFNYFARQVALQEMDFTQKRQLEDREIIRVGWSWGANIIPRAVGMTAVNKLIFIAGRFDEATLAIPQSNNTDGKPLPSEHSLLYDAAEKDPKTALLAMEEVGEQLIYHDVKDKILVGLIIGDLREHPKPPKEPLLTDFPSLPIEYIKLLNDRALLPSAQERAAQALGVNPVPFEGCHGIMVDKDRAKKLADLLIRLANRSSPSYTPPPRVSQYQAQ